MSNNVVFIDELNARYCVLKKQVFDIDWQIKCLNKLGAQFGNMSAKDFLEQFVSVVDAQDHILSEIYDPFIMDIVTVGKKYLSYTDAIKEYEKHLLGQIHYYNQSQGLNDESMVLLKNSQWAYETSKTNYEDKFGFHIDRPGDISSIYLHGLVLKKEQLNQDILKIREEASLSFDNEYKLELTSNDAFSDGTDLPEAMLLAKCPTGDKPCELLSDINRNEIYKDLYVNLREQGNVLVETDFEQTLDQELDQFVLAYIFRYIDIFPDGLVNVHIFDRNPNKYNQRLSNIFKEGSFSDRAKKTVTLYDYSSLSELRNVTSVIVDDLYKKFSYEYKDLYAFHEIDKTDPFTLIVLRDGLLDQSGYSASFILETINSLTTPNESGHLCGIRFLIIDDSGSRKQNESESTGFLINSIKNHCSTVLKYDSKEFYYNDEKARVLRITDDLDEFIQLRANSIAQRVTSLEKQVVSVSELSSPDSKGPDGSIYRIPIGKSGNTVVEIPLSCKDDNGTVDGQCIGYMVIGQSGSGKSSFFHSVVINGCLHYSPLDLQFWLLDFKYGGASSKYKNSQIPHVRIVSQDNKIDDALCLFQMIFDEMERRNKLFNSMSVDSIVDYNSLVDKNSRLPRIIVMIDEVQEIFRDENAAEIQKMINAITVRMRSAGMHFIMVAQNLSEGKSYMLKEAFLNSASGRICFRVAENMPRESGYDDAFVQRKAEISTLSTGEAYVSWGKDTIKKVKMAYASPDDMNNKLFNEIIAKYPEYPNYKPMVIGSKQRLSINSLIQTNGRTFVDEMRIIKHSINGYKAMVGEDAYRLSPLEITFSPYEMSSLLVLGEDKNIASSICASIALSLVKQNAMVHMFNSDRQKAKYGESVMSHPFMYLCSQLKVSIDNMVPHSLNDFSRIIAETYAEYIKRVNIVQMSDEEESQEFDSIFIIVNDLFGIKSFEGNERISNSTIQDNVDSSVSEEFNFGLLEQAIGNSATDKESFNEPIQNALEKLFKDGYNYNIFLVLAIKGDPAIWRNIRASEVNNVILFNSTQYANQVENQYFIKEMLKNISPGSSDETMAIWINKKRVSKMRPFIYDMSNQNEVSEINSLLEV